jgi:membrane associated rhomboid family serine protease
MPKCDRCGENESMPYRCRLCGGTYCADHRLPENHDCPGLENWEDPGGVFDSGFDDSVDGEQTADSSGLSLGIDTGPGSVLGYFRGNMTFVFLGLMWVTFALQWALLPIFLGIRTPPGIPIDSTWHTLFTLTSAHPEYVWTWVTSIFSHFGFTHIAFNSIVLYFFGPVVERHVGWKKFTALFLVTGALAGLAQTGAAIALGSASAVLGASGAIAAVMGVLTVLNPNLRIYLYFFIPMPLWIATGLFAAFAVFSSTVGGIGAGGTAQLAHLAGLGLGLAYGWKLKREGQRAPQQLNFGGGGGGGGMGGPGRGRI